MYVMLVCVLCLCALSAQHVCNVGVCVCFVFARIGGPNVCHGAVCVLCLYALRAKMSVMLVCVFCDCAH